MCTCHLLWMEGMKVRGQFWAINSPLPRWEQKLTAPREDIKAEPNKLEKKKNQLVDGLFATFKSLG